MFFMTFKNLSVLLFLFFTVKTAVAQEICGNGVDDDGDGLIDCLDPDCSGGTVPTGAMFNTGTNGAGGVLPGGSNDSHWQLSTGSITGPYAPAIVMSSIPGSYYASPWPDCRWISHSASGTHSGNVDFYYKTTFYLPCTNSCGASYSDSAVFCLNMDFYVDNSIAEVYVNGHPESGYLPGIPVAGPYSYVGFSSTGGSHFSICRDWQPGLNELIIKTSSGASYEGFLAQNSTTAPPVTGDPTIVSPASHYTVCLSTPSVSFSAVSPGGTWSASCGSCINSSTGAFSPSAAGSGTYTITYSLTTPCPASDTSVIEVLPAAPDATINPVAAHCTTDPAFNLTSATTGGVWSGTGITNASTGTFNPAVSGAGTFTITHVFSGSCGDTATQTVTVNAVPNATILPHPAVCTSTPPVAMTAAASGGTWSATCGSCINSSTGVFDPAVAGAGTYTITYAIGGACPATDTALMQVYPAAPDATINPVAAHCANDAAFNLTSHTAGGTWSGTGITNVSTGTFNPAVSGPGTFTITHAFSGSCGDTATQTVTVHAAPTPSVSVITPSGCAPQTIQFQETTGSGCASSMLYFGDGDSSSVTAPAHLYTAPGIYNLTMTCTSVDGCVGTMPALPVHVFSAPVADFTITPASPVQENTSVHFTNTSAGASTYAWLFGDAPLGTAADSSVSPSHTYAHEGDYCILLWVRDMRGCIDTAQYCIVVEGPSTITIPNVFTPNGDNKNDVFLVHTINVKELSYVIYDRWGLEIAEHEGITGGWNGQTKSGKAAPDGTYYYILKAVGRDDEKMERTGYVQLLSK